MQSNKLRMAIRAAAAVAVVGMAGQANAISFSTGGYDTEVYGYARLNASYDIDNEQSMDARSGSYNNLATDSGSDGHFGADAVQSRIGITTTTPEGVKITVEGDFRHSAYGGGNLRLRHAFGEYNGVLMGQTWSNYTSFVGNTATLDFDSLPGLAGNQGRVAQARYTTGALSFSLEEAQSSILGPVETKDSFPAITARLEDSQGGLSYSAAIIAQQVGYDTGTDDDSTMGFATFGALKLALTDMITIQGTLTYSDGANSHLYRSGNDFGAASAYVDGSGNAEALSGYGGSIGAGFNLGEGRSINIGYGMVEVDWDDAESDLGLAAVADQSETNSAIMANYQWTPINNVMMGVEYQFLKRENVDGSDGDANRILFAAQYNF